MQLRSCFFECQVGGISVLYVRAERLCHGQIASNGHGGPTRKNVLTATNTGHSKIPLDSFAPDRPLWSKIRCFIGMPTSRSLIFLMFFGKVFAFWRQPARHAIGRHQGFVCISSICWPSFIHDTVFFSRGLFPPPVICCWNCCFFFIAWYFSSHLAARHRYFLSRTPVFQ